MNPRSVSAGAVPAEHRASRPEVEGANPSPRSTHRPGAHDHSAPVASPALPDPRADPDRTRGPLAPARPISMRERETGMQWTAGFGCGYRQGHRDGSVLPRIVLAGVGIIGFAGGACLALLFTM